MIVNGGKLSKEILAELKKEILKLPRRLSVGAVLVGKNPASESFLKQKAKIADILGVNFKIFEFGYKITMEKLRREILKLNKNKKINGIIVQLPLPSNINTDLILKTINPRKDIDALSKNPTVLAPTAEAVKYIFEKYLPSGDLLKGDKINYKNKNILIVGCGRLVGQPIYRWLLSTTLSPKYRVRRIDSPNQLKLARGADIIISGVGKAGLIKGSIIKKGAILIDFGFSKKDGKINGDFDFASCAKKAKLITPVPGGMGPIMVAMLFKNLIKLYKNPK